MSARKKASDEEVIRVYRECGSVHKAGMSLGMNHASVHERLVKLGEATAPNLFTPDDEALLASEYVGHRNAGRLDELAVKMGRTKHFICRKARALGLTDQSAARLRPGSWKHMGFDDARRIMDDFKSSPLGLGRFCEDRGFGEVAFWQTMTRFFPAEWERVIGSKLSLGTSHGNGAEFEFETRTLLRKLGYSAMLSPGSRSPVDVVAIRTGQLLFVQCKLSGALPPSEWNALFRLARSVGATPLMASKTHRGDIVFHVVLAEKDGSRKRQPMKPFVPGASVEIAEASQHDNQQRGEA